MAVAPTYATLHASGRPWQVPGNMKEYHYTGTVGGSDTYETGGFSFTPATIGAQSFLAVEPVLFSTGHWGYYIPASNLIKVFSAAGTELANASTALQGATFVIHAYGV